MKSINDATRSAVSAIMMMGSAQSSTKPQLSVRKEYRQMLRIQKESMNAGKKRGCNICNAVRRTRGKFTRADRIELAKITSRREHARDLDAMCRRTL